MERINPAGRPSGSPSGVVQEASQTSFLAYYSLSGMTLLTAADAKEAVTTSLGAAYAAGLAVGFWDKVEDLHANWDQDKV